MNQPTPEQIIQWQEEAKRRYPDFEPYFQFTSDSYSMHFEPLSLNRAPINLPLFPTNPQWRPIEMFWRDNGKSEIDFLFGFYPDQSHLTNTAVEGKPRWLTVSFGAAATAAVVLGVGGFLIQIKPTPTAQLVEIDMSYVSNENKLCFTSHTYKEQAGTIRRELITQSSDRDCANAIGVGNRSLQVQY
jgi:hypothetical protein